jgi:hypothetical protein
MKRLLLIAIVILLQAACGSSGSSGSQAEDSREGNPSAAKSPHPFAGEAAWIAYQTDRGGEGTWLIHPDGTGDDQSPPTSLET